MKKQVGKFGGRVLRAFTGPKGRKYLPNEKLSPNDVADWPEANRRAMGVSETIDWFGDPNESDFDEEKEQVKKNQKQTDDKKKADSDSSDRKPARRRRAATKGKAKKK